MASKQRYIAFLDILGFKRLIETRSHGKMIELYQKIIRAKNDAVSYAKGKIKLHGNFPDSEIHAVIMSDSIVIYTEGGHWYNYIYILFAVQFIVARAIREDYTLRGALGFGEVFINTDSTPNNDFAVLGKTFVEAYLHSEEQQWHGCTISPLAIKNAQNSFTEWKNSVQLIPNEKVQIDTIEDVMSPLGNPVVAYNIPFKTSQPQFPTIYALDWTERYIQEESPNLQNIEYSPEKIFYDIATLLEKAFFRGDNPDNADKTIQEKYLNTIRFAEIVLRTEK